MVGLIVPSTVPRSGRNWHEAYLLLISALYGLGGLLSGRSSRAIEATFPAWGQAGWYAGLLAGSVLGMAGIALETAVIDEAPPPDEVLAKRLGRLRTGLVLERAAMRLLVGLCIAYVLGAFAAAPITQVTTGLGVAYVLAFALANLARARQITVKLPRVEAALRVLRGNPDGAA